MKNTLFVLVCAASCLFGQEGNGPFPAVMEQDPSLPTHTIYRPKDLAALHGQKLPIIAWGEGGCSNNGAFYKNFLGEIASYGFLVIATGPPRAPQAAGNPGAGRRRGNRSGQPARAGAGNWQRSGHEVVAADRRHQLGRRGERSQRQPVSRQDQYLESGRDGSLLRGHSGAGGCGGSPH